LWVPTAAAVIATALYAVQGGFSGGHGHFDRIIWALGVPGVLMAACAPAPLATHDLLLVVWWPALWNALFWAAVAEVLSRLRRQRATRNGQKLPQAHAGAYLHPDGFVLHAQHRAISGVLVGAPPVLRLPLNVSDAELGAALRTVLRAYVEGVRHPTDWSESGKAFLKAAGYRSWKSLEALARSCWIEVSDDRIVITPLRNGGSRGDQKGFQPFGAEPVISSISGDDDEVGGALKVALERAQ
jgi:hypothetical protein